jgi:alpha-N-arabinofuranosidase
MKTPASLILILSSSWIVPAAGQEDARIVVEAGRPKGKVVRDLFGTEIKCAQGGDGLMTGLREASNRFRPEVMDVVHRLQPTFMRYKFMRGAWSWEDGIGPLAGRKEDPAHQKVMGIDELLAFQLETIGDASKCQLVVSPWDPEQSAALVAYLNASIDGPEKTIGNSKVNGRDYKTASYWARRRADNGHPEPYGVTWFELGNENYVKDGGQNGDSRSYCERTKEVARAMKAVDPRLRCGLNLDCCPIKGREWRARVIEEGSAFADYFICHAYYPFAYPRNSKYRNATTNMARVEVEELYYKMIMAGAHQAWSDWRWFREQLVKSAPRGKSVRFCLTENGFHLEESAPAAQNTVLAGVYDVDLIGMMVEHAEELALDSANLYLLQGGDPWAFVHHSFARRDSSPVTLRPAYWSLYLWTHYFGITLVRTEVRSEAFDIPLPKGDDWPKEGIFWSRIAAQDRIPVLAAHSSLSADGKTLFLVVVNRDLYTDRETSIQLKGFLPGGSAEVHTLNTDVTATTRDVNEMFKVWDSNNEETPDAVRIRDSRLEVAGTTFRARFPAHSATALVLQSK